VYQGREAKASPFPFMSGAVTALLLTGAVLAVRFLVDQFQDLSALQVFLSCLFVAQLLFLARLPWAFFRRGLCRKLVAWFGHGEIELRGGRLLLGSRVGPLWWAHRRDVAEFLRVVVYGYSVPNPPLATGEPEKERYVLSIECAGASPWHLIDGFPRAMTLALGEDLNRRLGTAATEGVMRQFPPVEVIAAHEEKVYPTVVDAGYFRRRAPWWLAWHLSGTVGLATMAAATGDAEVWDTPGTRAVLFFGWLLEFAVITFTIGLAAQRVKAKGKKPAPPPEPDSLERTRNGGT
jgi:hypothetical protein